MSTDTTDPQADEQAPLGQQLEHTPQGEPADNAELGDAGKKAIAEERTARKAAEKQAAELRSQLDKIESANLSDLEKAQKRADAAEKALQAKENETLRLTIAAKHGLTGDAVDLLYGDDEATLEDRAARIAALAKGPGGPVVPGQGNQPHKAPESANDWLRNLAKH